MPQSPRPPRRRITDREQSQIVDLLNERVDDAMDAVTALNRRVSEIRNDTLETRRESNRRFDRIEERLEECFARNFEEHANVQRTANKIAADVEPTRWSKAKDFATFISVLIVPFLLTYLTIVLAGGAR